MKFIGYLIIIWSVRKLLAYIRNLFVERKNLTHFEEVGGESGDLIKSVLSEQVEIAWGGAILSLGALLVGIYWALYGGNFWQLAGFMLLLLSLGGVIQSFRPIRIERLLVQRGDYETSVNSMAWRLRMISSVELVIGLYLILKPV